MNISYLHLGSNIGNRQGHLTEAIDRISLFIGKIVKQSTVFETEAWGNTDQTDFLNQAISISTLLSPNELLEAIRVTENLMGRKREIKWGPRIIDIDIIFYNEDVINSTDLIIPHPFMDKRKFVLEPLNEIAAEFVHPVHNKSISELLEICCDSSQVNTISE